LKVKTRSKKYHLLFLVFLLNSVLFFLSCSSNNEQPEAEKPTTNAVSRKSPSPNPAAFSESIGILSREKATSKQNVNRLKNDYKNRKITEVQYKKGEDYYNQAQVAFNAWIDEIDASLIDRSPIDSPQRQESLSTAVNKRETFSEYVNSNYPEEILQLYSLDIDKLKSYLEAVKKLWDACIDLEKEQRQEMSTRITAMKWQDFKDIE
jgi:hypothetical protein